MTTTIQASTIALPEAETEAVEERAPLYNLVLFDDDEHSYAYVVEMLSKLFAMTPTEAFNVAYEVDHNGEAVVKTCGLDEALAGKEKIQTYGPDPEVEGSNSSMHAAVFEADQ